MENPFRVYVDNVALRNDGSFFEWAGQAHRRSQRNFVDVCDCLTITTNDCEQIIDLRGLDSAVWRNLSKDFAWKSFEPLDEVLSVFR